MTRLLFGERLLGLHLDYGKSATVGTPAGISSALSHPRGKPSHLGTVGYKGQRALVAADLTAMIEP